MSCVCCSYWLAATSGIGDEIPSNIVRILQENCLDCHDSEVREGGFAIDSLVANFSPQKDVEQWAKMDQMIRQRKMPPVDVETLQPESVTLFGRWFEQTFVIPGGQQHPGILRPRRLTREELQNTLEDILRINIRQPVTNSRLHVIPDTVIEKFFGPGVVGASGFSNDATTLNSEPIDVQSLARCFTLILNRLDADEQARIAIFGAPEISADLPLQEAEQILNDIGERAYRRPLDDAELRTMIANYRHFAAQRSPAESIRSTILAMLLTPQFLYRFEQPTKVPTPVVGFELATRLSYFLWSSPPDKVLRQLAAQGELRKPDILTQQVHRMLADPKRVALAENLGGEWFDYKRLRQQSSVDQRSDKMAGFYRTQFEEALLFFDSMIRFDHPIYRLVDADWGYSNRHQSKIYRYQTSELSVDEKACLPPINMHYRNHTRQIEQRNYEYKHAPLNLVRFHDRNQGGFLTMGSTLSVTSTPNRTSPIRRGVFVMERILGEHFVQPADVPALEETKKQVEKQEQHLSHTEILRLHSAQPGCVACHQYIDPIGFGLELYDQLGIRRANSQPGPNGEKLHWNPELTPATYTDTTWQLKQPFVPASEVRVFFQYRAGNHRLNIRNVRLRASDLELADSHFGYTGTQTHENVWHFAIPDNAPSNGWQLVAEIEGGGGTDSRGVITIAVADDDSHPSYALPNGKTFSSPQELKSLLMADFREQIIDNAVRRILSYALGRKIEPIDRPAVRSIKKKIKAEDYRMTSLFEAVVLSYPFRHKSASSPFAIPAQK